MPRIIAFCDESAKRGPHFSNFYGASLVLSEHLEQVDHTLREFYDQKGLTCEVKWNNITPSLEDRFINFADILFDHIESGRLKTRIMFTHNLYRPIGLTRDHLRQQYFLLYYQFIKHGLGLQHYGAEFGTRDLELICDQFPDTSKQANEFRKFLLGLNDQHFGNQGLNLAPENIGEAKSHRHMILQGTDLVLGAIQFKLNGLDKAIPPGKSRRGKKTLAKERVYRHILKRIWQIYPNFNIGGSTGTQGDVSNRWRHPYRHWKMVPSNHQIDASAKK